MQKTTRLPKLSFSITPNPQGYMIACNEMSYLFTNAAKIEDVDKEMKRLVEEYVGYFPDDAEKRGVDRSITVEAIWKATPNSVALD